MDHKFNTISLNETDYNSNMASENNSKGDFNLQPLGEIEKRILDVINSSLEKKIEEADIYNNFIDLGISSINFIQIVIALETEYEFEFDDQMLLMDNINNVKTMIEYVCSKICKGNDETICPK